ncbi:DUF1569 domain-containing protein [Algoriphagus resistens]|uniref:DUF1569 domain-containing protein n=1 Tax=Algoriphagus resistens TaxID=1750590 RepID=UPI000716B26A|nr:DUF1569 domain-containing protein [Algoriphagus resistens]
MKTVFERETREELMHRIHSLKKDNTPLWGEMNVFQMTKHNTYWNRWILGEGDFVYKQEFLGKIFGKIALKRMLKGERLLDKNIPTSEQFKVKVINGDLEEEKSKWVSLLGKYENYNNPEFVHDFLGKMTKEQIGIFVHKHTDHHLRQFGV